CQQFNDLLYTF
nr:immunoglobulin light chain junction region [Macaca mulatta]